jgi:hypothetical protein
MARKEVMQIRVSVEEKALISENARRAGMVPSDYLRQLGLKPHSEAFAFVPPSASPRVSEPRPSVDVLREKIGRIEPKPSKRCPSGCVSGITSPAVSRCTVCRAKLVDE